MTVEQNTAGTEPGGPGPPPPPPPQTVTRQYRTQQSASYQANGNRRNVNGIMYQGAAQGNPGGNGNQFAMAIMNYAALRADLAGASISRVRLTLRMTHSWWAAGGDVRLGYFNRIDFPPSGVGPPGQAAALGTHTFARGQTRTIDVTNVLRNVVGTTGFSGISVGPATSLGNLDQYVNVAGGSGGPLLEITFTR